MRGAGLRPRVTPAPTPGRKRCGPGSWVSAPTCSRISWVSSKERGAGSPRRRRGVPPRDQTRP